MATSCTCFKLCSVVVAVANVSVGIWIMVYGSYVFESYLDPNQTQNSIGAVIVYFQISTSLIFVGLLLLVGTIRAREKVISMYLLLSSLIWFVITILAVSYMMYYNTAQYNIPSNQTSITTTSTIAPTPKPTVPVDIAVGYSLGLILMWCGQLGVYKFHGQVIEKNMIDAGESYVSHAIHSN